MNGWNITQVKKVIYHCVIDSHPLVSREYVHYLDTSPSSCCWYEKAKEIFKLNWNYRIRRQPLDTELGRLPMPEMDSSRLISQKRLAAALLKYDVISFDVFDTLIFRAVEKPKDVFRLLEGEWNCMGFAKKRVQAEQDARKVKAEVSIEEIYHILAEEISIDTEEGIRREICMEHKVCYGNPYMLAVYKYLKKKGKKLLAVSDMYLPKDHVQALLAKCGYEEFAGIYVSCDYGTGKGNGELQKIAQAEIGTQFSYIHIGDNIYSDIDGSRKAGWSVYHYPNIQSQGYAYRRKEMTSLAASFYKGLVNSKMHCGIRCSDACYEYGYVYGGLLAYGYCQYLEQLARTEQIDQFLFVARDGYLLQRIYKEFFATVDSAYIPFSRFASYQLTMERNWREFLICCVRPIVQENPQKTISQVMKICDIEWIGAYLTQYGLSGHMKLNQGAFLKLERLFAEHAVQIGQYYMEQKEAGEAYFCEIIGRHKKICVVDVGWQGTSVMCLKYFLEEKCGMDITVCGALMGSDQNETAEINLDTKKVHSYLFSMQKNKEMLQRHCEKRQERDYRNLLAEILFTQDKPSFLKFIKNREKSSGVDFLYGADEKNSGMIRSIQAGIYDFCKDYAPYEACFKDWLTISGREAYIPLDALAGAKEYCIKLLGNYIINKNMGIFDSEQRNQTFRQIIKNGG